jgi:hypothetical protein
MLQVSITIAFSGSFTGTKNVYLYAVTNGGASSPYIPLGTWTVPATAAPLSVAPSSGKGLTNTFQLSYSGVMTGAGVLFNDSITEANACWIYYNTTEQSFWLRGNLGLRWKSLPPKGGVSNSQCTLNSGSAVMSGGNLQLTVSVTFDHSFSGTKNTYLYVVDVTGAALPYQQLGTWTIPARD